MISPTIPDKERLYRAILINWWNFKLCAISPAAFIDPLGVSVDRIADRSENEVIDSLKLRFRKKKVKAVCSLTAGECRRLDTFISYTKSKEKPYHADIWESKTVIEISGLKAFDLSREVMVDFLDELLDR